MGTVGKILLGVLGLGTVAVVTASYAAKKMMRYRIKYLIGTSPSESSSYFETKAQALTRFKSIEKNNSYVSLEERVEGTDDWKELKYSKGLGKTHK